MKTLKQILNEGLVHPEAKTHGPKKIDGKRVKWISSLDFKKNTPIVGTNHTRGDIDAIISNKIDEYAPMSTSTEVIMNKIDAGKWNEQYVVDAFNQSGYGKWMGVPEISDFKMIYDYDMTNSSRKHGVEFYMLAPNKSVLKSSNPLDICLAFRIYFADNDLNESKIIKIIENIYPGVTKDDVDIKITKQNSGVFEYMPKYKMFEANIEIFMSFDEFVNIINS